MWLRCALCLLTAAVVFDNVSPSVVTPAKFKYNPVKYQHILIQFDDTFRFAERDFMVALEIIGSLAYLGYYPVIAQSDRFNSTDSCSSKLCFVQKSRKSHIEITPSRFDLLPVEKQERRRLSSFNMSYTFGSSAVPRVASVPRDFSAYVCLHPCSMPDLVTSEGIENMCSYSLVVVFSEFSRRQYLSNLHDQVRKSGAVGTAMPVVKSIRAPLPEAMAFINFTASAENTITDREFRVGIGSVLFVRAWQQYLSKLVSMVYSLCLKHFADSLCEIVFFVDGKHGGSAYIQHRLESLVDKLKPLTLRVLAGPSVAEMQSEITRCSQYWSVNDLPEIMHHYDNGTISSYVPPTLIDPSIVFALTCGIPALTLDAGSAREMMPSVSIRQANLLVLKGLDGFRRSSEFLIRQFKKGGARIKQFHIYIKRWLDFMSYKTVISTIDKLMDKFPLAARYADFAKRKLPSLRSVSIRADVAARNVAVVIETSLSPTIEFAIRNVMIHLKSEWALLIFHSIDNELFLKHLLRDVKGVQYRRIDMLLLNKEAYSDLLKQPIIWQILKDANYKHALLFQADSIMLRSDIDQYLAYDYIGAPWCLNSNGINNTKYGVGNGGFSLRNISVMLHITQSVPPEERLLEDVYFVSKLEKGGIFFLPPRSIAYNFAIETFCVAEFSPFSDSGCNQEKRMGKAQATTSVNDVPLGLHAAWLYGNAADKCIVNQWVNNYYIEMANA